MKSSIQKRAAVVALGAASKQTKGAEGLFTDDVLKSRISAGLAAD